MWKIFPFVPSKKTCHQRKLRQTKCLFFNFWMIELIKTLFAELPSSKCFFFGFAQFSLVTDFFEATRENSQKESLFYEHIVKEVFVCIKNSFSVKEWSVHYCAKITFLVFSFFACLFWNQQGECTLSRPGGL